MCVCGRSHWNLTGIMAVCRSSGEGKREGSRRSSLEGKVVEGMAVDNASSIGGRIEATCHSFEKRRQKTIVKLRDLLLRGAPRSTPTSPYRPPFQGIQTFKPLTLN